MEDIVHTSPACQGYSLVMENGSRHNVRDLFNPKFGCESSSLLEFTKNKYTRNDVFTGCVKPRPSEGKKMSIWGLRFTVQLKS